MPKNKRKFIKKDATTFSLINRPLHPIGEDEDADQGNLKVSTEEELLARKEEEHKCGIYYNDNYDYMRHLRDVSSYQGNLVSVEQFRVGSSASNHPHPLQPARDPLTTVLPPDPDLLDTFDATNFLDDDFIQQAGGVPHYDEYPGIDEAVDPTAMIHKNGLVGAWIDHQEPGAEVDGQETAGLVREWVKLRGEPLGEEEGAMEETGSRVSRYSMSSSVLRRSNGLKTLDQHFEHMFGQYAEEEIGGLDLDDHEGHSDNLVLRTILAEQAKKTNGEDEEDDSDGSSEPGVDQVALKFRYEDGEREELVKVLMEEEDAAFDCQSILSHRSVRFYQPRLISVPGKPRLIRLNKIGFPVPDPGQKTPKEMDVLSLISSMSVARSKRETAEERNRRQHTLKELRRERRAEKKANKRAFGQEKARQERMEASVEGRMRTVVMV